MKPIYGGLFSALINFSILFNILTPTIWGMFCLMLSLTLIGIVALEALWLERRVEDRLKVINEMNNL